MQRRSSKRKSTKAARRAHPDALAYSLDQAAVLLGVSKRTVYSLINDGRILTRKLRSRRVIPRVVLERLLDEESE